MNGPSINVAFRNVTTLGLAIGCLLLTGCPGGNGGGTNTNTSSNTNTNTNTSTNTNNNTNDNTSGPQAAIWQKAFNAAPLGFLSGIWGTGPDNIYIVGGTELRGEVYHYDGTTWSEMKIPQVPLLVWVYGFGPDDIWAVGEGGGAIHYDGQSWTLIETGTTEALWGVWGNSPDLFWVVGGNVGQGEPVILRGEGTTFTSITPPDDNRGATSLFKVWGIGSKTFAVGEKGLIIEFDGENWFQVPTGPLADADFVSLWGTSENNIVAVGGRSDARIAVYDGQSWTTQFPIGLPGLNAVYMISPDEAIIGGGNGYVATFNPQTSELTTETSNASEVVHAMFGDGEGLFYAVGGIGTKPFAGLALVRAFEELNLPNVLPTRLPCTTNVDCNTFQVCGTSGECEPEGGVVECVDSTSCPDGTSCIAGECLTGCLVDTDCSFGDYCLDGACTSGADTFCVASSPCPFGFFCGSSNVCAPSSTPAIQLGVLDAITGFTPLQDGDTLVAQAGFQGLVEIRVTIQSVGFPEVMPRDVQVTPTILLTSTGEVLNNFSALASFNTGEGPGITMINNWLSILDISPVELDGQELTISFTVTSQSTAAQTASATVTVVADVQGL